MTSPWYWWRDTARRSPSTILRRQYWLHLLRPKDTIRIRPEVVEGLAHGLEILAGSDVNLAAKADGITSINIVSAGEIDITANSDFGFCPGHAPNSTGGIPVFRMVW